MDKLEPVHTDKSHMTPKTPEQKNSQELHTSTSDELVARYQAFANTLQVTPGTIYHPCGANDVSPSVAFPNSSVIYVDKHNESMIALRDAGYNAITASALDYDPGTVDLVILLNPVIAPDVPVSHVKNEGFVLCNNYHSTAIALYNNPEFKFIGVIVPDRDGGFKLDTEQLDQYWQEIETDDEWKSARFTWGGENYEMAAQIIEEVTGKRENVLREFRRITAEAQEQQRIEYEELLTEHPDFADLIINDDDAQTVTVAGKRYFFSTDLPKKKGTVDDTFVFQKVTSPSQK